MAYFDEKVLTVSRFGGAQYTSIADAMEKIEDASADNIYHILVVGNVLEVRPIHAKSYVNVVGLPGMKVDFRSQLFCRRCDRQLYYF